MKRLLILVLTCVILAGCGENSRQTIYPGEIEHVSKMCDPNGGVDYIKVGFDRITVTCVDGMVGFYTRTELFSRYERWGGKYQDDSVEKTQ